MNALGIVPPPPLRITCAFTVRPFRLGGRLGGRFGVTLNLVSATGLPLDLMNADSPEGFARFTSIVFLTLALLIK